jgi:preprotein translocase subunit SecB
MKKMMGKKQLLGLLDNILTDDSDIDVKVEEVNNNNFDIDISTSNLIKRPRQTTFKISLDIAGGITQGK